MKGKLLLLFFLITGCIQLAYTQVLPPVCGPQENSSSVADFRITTRASDDMTVCRDAITFTVKLEYLVKNSASATAGNVDVAVRLPDGIEFVGNVSGATLNSASGQLLSFSLKDINGIYKTIANNGFEEFSFQARARCGVIANIASSSSGQIVIRNQTRACYRRSDNNTFYSSDELEGSGSYNVLFPSIELSMSQTDNKQFGTLGDDKVRRLVVTNSGFGSLDGAQGFKVTINYPSGLSLQSITSSQGTVSIQTSGSSKIVTVTGFGDFDKNESIELTETVRVVGCETSHQTDYLVTWGCDNIVCNPADNNAKLSSFVNKPLTLNPNLTVELLNSPQFGFCAGSKSEIHARYTNVGETVTNGIYALGNKATTLRLLLSSIRDGNALAAEYVIDNVRIKDNTGNFVSIPLSLIPSGSSTNDYFVDFNLLPTGTDLDGTGYGLSDLDHDGIFDDLAVNDILEVKFDITQHGCPFGQATVSGFSERTNLTRVYYSDACYSGNGGGYNRNSYDIYYPLYNGLNAQSLQVPEDIVQGQVYTITMQHNRYRGYDQTYDAFSNSDYYSSYTTRYRSELTLPAGLSLAGTSLTWTPTGGSPVTISGSAITQVGNKLIIQGGGIDGAYQVPLQLTCQSGTGYQNNIHWEMYYDWNSCGCEQKVADQTAETFTHCPTCPGFHTSDFDADRNSFGYQIPDAATLGRNYYTFGDLASATPPALVNSGTPGIELKKGLEYDMIRAVIPGYYNGSVAVNNAHVQVEYTSSAGEALLEFVNGQAEIKDLVNNITWTGAVTSSTLPVESPSGSGRYVFDLSINLSSVTGGLIQPGYQINVTQANFRVRKVNDNITSPGLYPFTRFRAEHFGIISGNREACESFGDHFSVVIKRVSTRDDGAGDNCSNMYRYVELRMDGGNVDDFPNEVRPIGHITSIQYTLPPNTSHKASTTLFENYGYPSYSYIQKLVHDPTTTSGMLTWTPDASTPINSDEIWNGGGNYYQIIYLDLKTTCQMDPDVYNNQPSIININYTQFDYSPANLLNKSGQGKHYASDARNSQYEYNNGSRQSAINITYDQIQEGYQSTVTWPVYLCNQQYPTPNTWIRLRQRANNVGKITSITAYNATNGQNVPLTVYTEAETGTLVGKTAYMILVGDIAGGECRQVNIVATYSGCQQDVVDEFDLLGSWGCTSFPSALQVLNPPCIDGGTYSYSTFTGILQLRYKTAGIAMTVNQALPKVELCQDQIYTVTIRGDKYADMNQVDFWVEIPNGIIPVTSESTFGLYTYPSNNPSGSGLLAPHIQPLPVVNYTVTKKGKRYYWKLFNTGGINPVGGDGQVKTELPGSRVLNDGSSQNNFDNEIVINLKVKPVCNPDPALSYDQGWPLRFYVQGKTNCGVTEIRNDQRKLERANFNPDVMNVTIDAGDYLSCGATAGVSVTVQNAQSIPNQFDEKLTVELPAGVSYLSGSANVPPSGISTVGGITVLTWLMPTNTIGGNVTKIFTFQTQLVDGTIHTALYSATTTIESSATCIEDLQSCNLTTTTGFDDVTKSVNIILPVVTITKDKVEYCEGETAHLTATLASGTFTGYTSLLWYINSLSNAPSGSGVTFSIMPNAGITKVIFVASVNGICSVSDTIDILTNPAPNITGIETIGESCTNPHSFDGSMAFTVTGGLAPYTVVLSGGNLTSPVTLPSTNSPQYSYSGLQTAVYSITITDSKGCQRVRTIEIGNDGPTVIELCHANTGCGPEGPSTATPGFTANRIRPAGGTFTYEIINTATNLPVSISDNQGVFGVREYVPGLSAGNYQIRVTANDNGCIISGGDLKVEPLQTLLTLNGDFGDGKGPQPITDQKFIAVCSDDVCTDAHLNGLLQLFNLYPCTQVENVQKTFHMQKEQPAGSGTWVDVAGSPVVTNGYSASYSFPYGDKANWGGKYRFYIEEGARWCTDTIHFEIGITPPVQRPIFITHQTCEGVNNGTAEVANDNDLVYPITYFWYDANAGTSRCERVLIDSLHGYKIKNMPPGKYCVQIADSRFAPPTPDQIVDCGCSKFEIYPYNNIERDENQTPGVYLEPRQTQDKGTKALFTALTNNVQVTGCSASFGVQGGTPAYEFTWVKIETITKTTVTAVVNPGLNQPKYVVTTTQEIQENQVHQERGEKDSNGDPLFYKFNPDVIPQYTSVASDLTTGKYRVTVRDFDNCELIVKEFEIKAPARTYNVCFRWKEQGTETPPSAPAIPQVSLAAITATDMARALEEKAQQCVNKKAASIGNEQGEKCHSLEYLEDEVDMTYKLNYHHFTLYYYDRSGALVRTVPPNGVDATYTDRSIQPLKHTYVTSYDYNSIQQLEHQLTPDGGASDFIYDNKGQLRFSQNARQSDALENPAGKDRYSYTKYDRLGRIVEVGEEEETVGSFASLNTQADNASIPTSTTTNEQTYTTYTEPATWISYFGQSQRHLINRVSYIYTINMNGDTSYTFFSYDPHGNVEWLIQQIPGMSKTYIAYEYDLISNKVIKVKYNEQLSDRYFHRYGYDEDNRITKVETSRDGYLWDADATYSYYAHGPLRTNGLGEDHIQKLDYIYTLQGWLKAVNHPDLATNSQEGTTNLYAQDQFGMMLGYFKGDFTRTGSQFRSDVVNPYYLDAQIGANRKDLYNGNISTWVAKTNWYSSGDPYNQQLTGHVFTYDRLNRLKSTNFRVFNGTAYTATANDDYKTTYTYDANGNILNLMRNSYGAGNALDNLTYTYATTINGNSINTNRLIQVQDALSGTAYTDDIEAGQATNNYVYDKTGNLIKDVQENLKQINWTVYGKVSEVIPTYNALNPSQQKPQLRFSYDATGNRIKKEVNRKPYDASGVAQRNPEDLVTTYYMKDASGNTMAVYERENTPRPEPDYYTATWKIVELPLYGSERLGEYKPGDVVAAKLFHKDQLDEVVFTTEGLERKPEYYNWLTNSNTVDGSNVPTSHVYGIPYNKTTATYTAAELLNFQGETNTNITLAEDSSGQVQVYAVTAKEYWGADNLTLVYDRDGNIMTNSDGIFSDPKSKSILVKRPGNPEYLLVTRGLDEKLYYHTIDMSLAGNGTIQVPKGEVTLKNQVLDVAAGYGRHFAVVEDYINDRTILYATQYTDGTNLGTTSLVRFELSNDENNNGLLITKTVQRSYASQDVTGEGDLQISPDGTKLVVYSHLENVGWSAQQLSELRSYSLSSDYNIITVSGITQESVSSIDRGTVPESGTDISRDSKYLYYTQREIAYNISPTSFAAVYKQNLNGGTAELVKADSYGNIRRGKDKNIYVANLDNTLINSYKIDIFGVNAEDIAKTVTIPEAATGALPLQVHKVYHKLPENEQYLYRIAGEKVYELKDHLGNVTVVVTDVKEATLSASTITGYEASVASYTHYYAFGMAMPGRSYNSTDYRYGFNGMEKDDELKGNGNSYDFGARIYDPRVGRWLSLDPLAKKYPSLSPYHAMADNPILVIDSDGKENVIYLVIATDKNGKPDIDVKKARQIAIEANNMYEKLGVNTRVVVFDEKVNGKFNVEYIDKTDNVAIVGTNRTNIVTTMADRVSPAFADYAEQGEPWSKGANNPETTNRGGNAGKGNGLGILVDADDKYGYNAGSQDKNTASSIVHGSGHNTEEITKAGGHLDYGIMASGDRIETEMNLNPGKTFEKNILDNTIPDNKKYKAAMETRYSSNQSKDNYNTNRIRSQKRPGYTPAYRKK